jgi:phosphoribosylamine---glycine ligase
MKVLLIGSGGREHAIAWKLAQSPHLTHLWIAPGNAGTSSAGENIAISADDLDSLTTFAKRERVDLVVIGPEAPLAAGLADRLREAGIRAFGPTQAAARLESSKVFAKDFMQRHGIPTARFRSFSDYNEADKYLRGLDYPVVIKASGLAAGKGVLIPQTPEEARRCLRQVMMERVFGDAGNACVIEERLEGEEVSLLAFCDGTIAQPMPPAQDHKRVFNGDQGPNTGGMGAYAPAPVCPPAKVEEFTRTILQPTLDGMRAEGTPYSGVLYAGLMLTSSGVRVIEYNCRFGDPETQVILPLLESDLLEVLTACADGKLAGLALRWRNGAAACVVLSSGGYPGSYETGKEISGWGTAQKDEVIFHAGTKNGADGRILTAGGRVLCVTGLGDDIPTALRRAYTALAPIRFEGMHYRKDIGRRAIS